MVGKQSPERRAAILKIELKDHKLWRGRQQKFADPRFLVRRALQLRKGLSSLKFTDKGIEVYRLLDRPYFKLLAKSWNFIVNECRNEFEDIMRVNNFRISGLNFKDIVEEIRKYLSSWQVSEVAYDFGALHTSKEEPGSGVFRFLSPDKDQMIFAGASDENREGELRWWLSCTFEDSWIGTSGKIKSQWITPGSGDEQVSFDNDDIVQSAVDSMLTWMKTLAEKEERRRSDEMEYGINNPGDPDAIKDTL